MGCLGNRSGEIAQFAHMVKKMASLREGREGDGKLLDN
jgi:hypothetical protein